MNWKLFLDDKRAVHDVYPSAADDEFIVARDYAEAWRCIASMRCMPSYIAFDHDLGTTDDGITIGRTGFDFAKALVEADLDGDILLPEDFSFGVHSSNPGGAENIRGLLQRYLDFKKS